MTFIYLACSGAQIDSGILGIKDGNLGGAEEPQTKQAYQLTIAAYAYLIAPAQGSNASGSAHPNMLGLETYRIPLARTMLAAANGW